MKQHSGLDHFFKNSSWQNNHQYMYAHRHDQNAAAPSVPSVTEFSSVLAGTADAKSWVVISVGQAQYRVKADAQGNWSIDNPIQDGGSAAIYSVNQFGVRSEDIQIAKIAVVPLAPENDLSDVLTAYADVETETGHQDQGVNLQASIDVDSLLRADPVNEAQSVWLEPNAVLGLDAVLPQQGVQSLSVSFEYRMIELDAVQPAAHWVA